MPQEITQTKATYADELPNFVIVRNVDKCPPEECDRIVSALRSMGAKVYSEFPEYAVDEDVFVVTLGGDGTIISTIRKMGLLQRPIIGINFGKLGYLAHFNIDQVLSLFEKRERSMWPRSLGLIANVHRRMMLSVKINKGHKTLVDSMAVNDCVIDIGPPFRANMIAISVNKEKLTEIRGDGIIVSTSTGSTAYNMSAGGPILHPKLGAIILTPKNPHRLSIRPIVIPAHMKVEITLAKGEGTYAIMDGQESHLIEEQSSIVVEKYPAMMQIVENPEIGYFETLTKKLNWGV